MTLSSCSTMESPKKLPEYVKINHPGEFHPTLKTPAQGLSFPLSEEDIRDIHILEAKFDGEENCAGLAAPQIGIKKKIIIFAAEDPEGILRKFRPDFTQFMPKTIWVNPSYVGISLDQDVTQNMHEDYEACFSVEDIAGVVPRYKKIRYQAYTLEGEKITGEAEGFLARIIQHEIDHIEGVLFVDRAAPNTLMPIEEYRKKRAKALGSAPLS